MPSLSPPLPIPGTDAAARATILSGRSAGMIPFAKQQSGTPRKMRLTILVATIQHSNRIVFVNEASKGGLLCRAETNQE